LKVFLQVVLDVDKSRTKATNAAVVDSCVEAINNALYNAKDNGFDHTLLEEVSINDHAVNFEDIDDPQ